MYEQVTDVNSFFFIRAFAFAVAVVVALHSVCNRTLMSRMRSGLGAGWGSRGESILRFIRRLSRPKRRRSHRNAVSMQRVNFMRPVEGTSLIESIGDG